MSGAMRTSCKSMVSMVPGTKRGSSTVTMADQYPSCEDSSKATKSLVASSLSGKKKATAFLDPAQPESARRLSAAMYVQNCYRGYRVRAKQAHRMYRVNLKYELSLIRARKDRRGMCVGFFQRARPPTRHLACTRARTPRPHARSPRARRPSVEHATDACCAWAAVSQMSCT